MCPSNVTKRELEPEDHQTPLVVAESGAGNRARTGHLDLGKVALYQMSYTRIERGELYRCEVVRQVFIFMLKIHYLIDGSTGEKAMVRMFVFECWKALRASDSFRSRHESI